jgi:uncharacterized membrane protein YvlD (DUF360 family)
MQEQPTGGPNDRAALQAYLQTTPWPLLGITALLGLMHLILQPLLAMSGPFTPLVLLVIPYIGCTAAQFAAVAMWFAWSRGEILWRVSIIAGISGGLLVLLGCGIAVVDGLRGTYHGPFFLEMVWFSITSTSFLLTAACLPLWILRLACGWGILPVVSEEQRGFTKQISIRDIMVATVIVAVLTALARPMFSYSGFLGLQLLITTLFAGMISLLTLIPFAYWMLHDAYRKTGLGYCLGWAAMTPFVFFFLLAWVAPPGNESLLLVAGMFGVCYAYCASVLFMLHACRKAGFRLVTAWDRLPGEEIKYLSVSEQPSANKPEIVFLSDDPSPLTRDQPKLPAQIGHGSGGEEGIEHI